MLKLLDTIKQEHAEGQRDLRWWSEYGWAIMDEYEGDKLASDKGDVKRTEKAKKVLTAKAVKRKKAANPQSSRQVQDCPQKSWEQSSAHEQRIATLRNPIGHDQLPVADPCFHYGEIWHLRAMCPKLVKIYPFDDVKCVNKPLRDCDKLEVNSPGYKNVKSCCEKGSKVKEKGVSTCTCSDVGSW